METTMRNFEQKARRAYELGRARRALAFAVPALGPAVFTAALVGLTLWQSALVAAIVLACWAAAYWHRSGEATALAGLTAGLIPFATAIVATSCMSGCATGDCCSTSCTYICLGAGTAAGVAIPLLVGRVQHQMVAITGSAALAAAVGSLGCHHIGAGGALGIAAGVAIGLAPRLVFGRRATA